MLCLEGSELEDNSSYLFDFGFHEAGSLIRLLGLVL